MSASDVYICKYMIVYMYTYIHKESSSLLLLLLFVIMCNANWLVCFLFLFYNFVLSFHRRQSSPALSQVSAGILAMRESTKMGSLISQYFGEAASTCAADKTELLGVTRMSMRHMGGIFILAMFGVLVSFCFYVCCRRAENNDLRRTQSNKDNSSNTKKKTTMEEGTQKKMGLVMGNGEDEEYKETADVELTAVQIPIVQRRSSDDAGDSDVLAVEGSG